MKKTISIIMPAYNAEDTIEKAIDSILNQTYQDFEIIVVDDGSTDSTRDIVKRYAENDNRIKLVENAHGGVSKARNTGVKNATGDYIQFIDADDLLHPTMMEKMVGLIENNNADLACCRFNHFCLIPYYEKEVFDLTNENELFKFYQDCFGLVLPWNKLWKKEAFTVPFDETIKISEDELCNFSNLPNVKKVATTDEYLYQYTTNHVQQTVGQEQRATSIDKLFGGDFWNRGSTFCAQLLKNNIPGHEKVVDKAIETGIWPKNLEKELKYLYVLDYAFMQTVPLVANGAPKFGVEIEMNNILNSNAFKQLMESQVKFGLRPKNLTEEEFKDKLHQFIDLCYQAFDNNKQNRNLDFSRVFLSIYLMLFTEQCGELSELSKISRAYKQVMENSTAEAKAVRELLKI